MTITATPTLYSEVGLYTIDAVFTAPIVSTKTSIFTLDVVDPCLKEVLNWDIIEYPVATTVIPYTFGDGPNNSTMTVINDIDVFFGTDYTCGPVTLQDFTSDDIIQIEATTDPEVFKMSAYMYSGYDWIGTGEVDLVINFNNDY